MFQGEETETQRGNSRKGNKTALLLRRRWADNVLKDQRRERQREREKERKMSCNEKNGIGEELVDLFTNPQASVESKMLTHTHDT